MAKAWCKYGDWETRGERIDAAVYSVASVHHFRGDDCLCGAKSATARRRTEHIIDATLAALAASGVVPPTDEERNGRELSDYLRSFIEPKDEIRRHDDG